MKALKVGLVLLAVVVGISILWAVIPHAPDQALIPEGTGWYQHPVTRGLSPVETYVSRLNLACDAHLREFQGARWAPGHLRHCTPSETMWCFTMARPVEGEQFRCEPGESTCNMTRQVYHERYRLSVSDCAEFH